SDYPKKNIHSSSIRKITTVEPAVSNTPHHHSYHSYHSSYSDSIRQPLQTSLNYDDSDYNSPISRYQRASSATSFCSSSTLDSRFSQTTQTLPIRYSSVDRTSPTLPKCSIKYSSVDRVLPPSSFTKHQHSSHYKPIVRIFPYNKSLTTSAHGINLHIRFDPKKTTSMHHTGHYHSYNKHSQQQQHHHSSHHRHSHHELPSSASNVRYFRRDIDGVNTNVNDVERLHRYDSCPVLNYSKPSNIKYIETRSIIRGQSTENIHIPQQHNYRSTFIFKEQSLPPILTSAATVNITS
ncbi:unnamed protein product, partial [Didymodactylos carnosus]